MYDAALVRIRKRTCDFDQAAPDQLGLGTAQSSSGASRHVFHRQIQVLAAATGIQHRDQVAVPECTRDARLAQEPFGEIGVGGECRTQHLQRDLAPE